VIFLESTNKQNNVIKDDSSSNDNKNQKLKNLFKGKNLVIFILSFLLFCAFCSIPSDNTSYLQNTIESLNTNILEQQKQIEQYKEEKKLLQKEIDELKKDLQNLETENNTLRTSKQSTTLNTTSNITTQITQSKEQISDSAQTVWVGNTGTKYHKQSCRTLKGNGHQIPYQQALNEGREACKVCY
jgi:septal ring factor EnvC (AmiA/AmiB activator)